jgi:citronellyl-CoA dehydrogenase
MSAITEAPPEAATNYPYFTEEHDMFRENGETVCSAEIAPHAEEWDEAGIFPREIFKKSADLGLFGIRLDPKYGGSGLDWWYTAAYLEGFSYSNSGGRLDGDVCSI